MYWGRGVAGGRGEEGRRGERARILSFNCPNHQLCGRQAILKITLSHAEICFPMGTMFSIALEK